MLGIIVGAVFLVSNSVLGAVKYEPCTCAVMESEVYDKNTVPLVEQSLNLLPGCGETENLTCKKFCYDMAERTRADPEGRKQFCRLVKKDVKNVYVHIFSKACDNNFVFTGYKADQPICCVNGAKVPCTN